MEDRIGSAAVLIVDDDEGVRDSMAALFEAYGLTTRTFADGSSFLAAVTPGHRGCVLLDIRLPDITGLIVQAKLKERGINLAVVMITAFGDVPLAVAAMRAGATDFLEKPFTEEVLVASVRAALERADAVAGADEDAARITARMAQLTPREHEVLERLLVGAQNKQIAYELGISPRTVEIHRARVMEKMQAGSLSQLVRQVLTARGDTRIR